ncbi:hypothetical protein LCGC14_2365760, partial [marine sediment metagenome]
LRFVYRTRKTRMVNGTWLFREGPHDDIKAITEENLPAAWKAEKPYTDAQITEILDEMLNPAAKGDKK